MTEYGDFVKGATVLVTGANRGLGQAFAAMFLKAGAAKVYAGVRDLSTLQDSRLIPVTLDVTSRRDIDAAAALCRDVDILINNAGIMIGTPVLADTADDALHRELEVNLYGPLRMSKAFAPILDANGGGAIINVLSVVSWFVNPLNHTYCISKHAAQAATDALRIELAGQGTRVLGVYSGFIDTDMGAVLSDGPKTSPDVIAEFTLEGLRTGEALVLADERARRVWQQTFRTDVLA